METGARTWNRPGLPRRATLTEGSRRGREARISEGSSMTVGFLQGRSAYEPEPGVPPGLRGARFQAIFVRSSYVEIGWNLWGFLPHFLPQAWPPGKTVANEALPPPLPTSSIRSRAQKGTPRPPLTALCPALNVRALPDRPRREPVERSREVLAFGELAGPLSRHPQ